MFTSKFRILCVVREIHSCMHSTSVKCLHNFVAKQLLWCISKTVVSVFTKKNKKSPATAEIVRDADDVDCSVDRVHSASTLAFNYLNTLSSFCKQTNHETAIQGHSRSSVVVPIDAAYMTSY